MEKIHIVVGMLNENLVKEQIKIKKISSSIIIDSAEYSATLGEIEEIAITFTTTGTITSAI